MATNSPHSTSHADTAALSLSLLMLVREVAHANKLEALMRFGVEEDLVDALLAADHAALKDLCQSGKLVFTPSFSEKDLHASAIRAGVAKPSRGSVSHAQ